MAVDTKEFAPKPKSEESVNATTSGIDFNELIINRTNPLLNYDAVAWRFKLYTMSMTDYRKYQSDGSNVTELVISETGATSKYNIESVEQTSMPPCTFATKNSTMMKTVIVMSEQGSMTFFDDLQIMSTMLGYSQVMDIPLFLELTFVGYDSFGTNKPTMIPGTTKLWRLHINNINTSIENSGATTIYEITTTPLAFVMPDSEWRLTEQIEMIATRDVKSFIEAFSVKINSIANNQYGYLTHMFASELQPNTFFTFHVHPKIGELVLINDSVQDAANDKSPTGPGTKRFVFEPKQTIGNVIDAIMDSAQAKGVNSDTGKVQKRQFVNVVPVSKYVGFDRFRKKHVYRYDIYVLPYQTVDYQDVDDTKNANTAFDLKRVLEAANPGTKFLMKRYDYLWSGLNSEILELDMHFNSAYVMVAPKNLSSMYDEYNRDGIKRAELKPFDQIASSEELQKLYLRKQELSAKQHRTEADEKELETATVALNATTPIEGEAEQSFRPSIDNKAFLEQVTQSLSVHDFTETYDGTSLAVNVQVDYKNGIEKSSNTSDSNSSQTEVSKRAIRSNYYNENFLMKLDMTVMGDPYWLGKSEKDTITDLKLLVSGSTVTVDETNLAMNQLDSEACLLLNLEPAKSYDQNTGLIQQDNKSILAQTVYRVMKIVSTFSSDGFKQDLTASMVARSINRK